MDGGSKKEWPRRQGLYASLVSCLLLAGYLCVLHSILHSPFYEGDSTKVGMKMIISALGKPCIS